jgi:hypothetical protein
MKKHTARLIGTITPREAVLLNRASAEAILICVLGLFAAMFGNASAAAQSAQAGGSQQPQLMDRDKEIALALSACPATVASKAAVYVLEKSGYVKVKDSENGFTAIVQHVRPTSQEPQCLDAEAARVFLPRILKVAELRAQGKTQQEIQAFLSEAVAKGTFSTPTQPGIIYMLSDQNFNTNGKGEVFPPHAMFYGTHLTNADLGVDSRDLGQDGNPKGPIFVAGDGSPFGFIIVPVNMRAETAAGQGKPLTTIR